MGFSFSSPLFIFFTVVFFFSHSYFPYFLSLAISFSDCETFTASATFTLLWFLHCVFPLTFSSILSISIDYLGGLLVGKLEALSSMLSYQLSFLLLSSERGKKIKLVQIKKCTISQSYMTNVQINVKLTSHFLSFRSPNLCTFGLNSN